MAFGLFKRRPRAPTDNEWKGPLDLVPGDRVTYYQQELTLAGVIFLIRGKEKHCQYHFLDEGEEHVVIAFGAGPDPLISIQRPLSPEQFPDPAEEVVRYGETVFRRGDEEEVQAFAFGGVPPEKGETARVRVYEDEEELATLVVEDWDGYVEARAGDFIVVNELVIHRQRDGEEWDVKPLPRIDLRSLNEARRAKELERRRLEEEKRQADLAAAREKLAALEAPEPVAKDPEDVVALSEIVDPSFRFGTEAEQEEESIPPEDIEDPSELGVCPFIEDEEDSDPFADEFAGAEEPAFASAPDPYQDYMQGERDNDFEDLPAQEPAFAEESEDGDMPILEPHPRQSSSDSPTNFLTEDTSDEFINAGIDDEDDAEVP